MGGGYGLGGGGGVRLGGSHEGEVGLDGGEAGGRSGGEIVGVVGADGGGVVIEQGGAQDADAGRVGWDVAGVGRRGRFRDGTDMLGPRHWGWFEGVDAG